MRMQTLLIALGAVALSSSALAAPGATPEACSPAVVSVQTVTGNIYKLRPVEFAGVQGVYNLDNGETLRITAEHRKLFVQIGANAKSEIVALASNTFVATDDRMKLVFDQVPFASEVRISYN